MPVTFKTKSYANITMLDESGKKMLEMMDYGSAIPGGISHADLNEALENLQQALAKIPDITSVDPPDPEKPPPVPLSTRAFPLIELLKSAIKEEGNLRWE